MFLGAHAITSFKESETKTLHSLDDGEGIIGHGTAHDSALNVNDLTRSERCHSSFEHFQIETLGINFN
jgi:hypothetical protein